MLGLASASAFPYYPGMSNHPEHTLPHDLAAFEGDWWLLIEEEELERTPEQRWTLQAGRVSHLGSIVGAVAFQGDALAINTATRGVMRFHPHDAAPLSYLQGDIEDGVLPTYCTLIRVGGPQDAGSSQDG
jgi:hypothetical protein